MLNKLLTHPIFATNPNNVRFSGPTSSVTRIKGIWNKVLITAEIKNLEARKK